MTKIWRRYINFIHSGIPTMFELDILIFWKKEQKATSFVCLHKIRYQLASPNGIYTHFTSGIPATLELFQIFGKKEQYLICHFKYFISIALEFFTSVDY